MAKKQKKNGFTLIEMMIVLSILGILSSILIPNFSKIRSIAKNQSVIQVAHTLQMAIETYHLSQGTYPSGTLTIEELSTTLITAGEFNATPKNPYTGTAYTDADSSGKIEYAYDGATNTYTLSVYGLDNAEEIESFSNAH